MDEKIRYGFGHFVAETFGYGFDTNVRAYSWYVCDGTVHACCEIDAGYEMLLQEMVRIGLIQHFRVTYFASDTFCYRTEGLLR